MGIPYILLARTTAKIYRPNIISVSNLSSETHMDAVEYLVVYFISESNSESKLTQAILFYVDSKPTCSIHINCETIVRSCAFYLLGHILADDFFFFFSGVGPCEEIFGVTR